MKKLWILAALTILANSLAIAQTTTVNAPGASVSTGVPAQTTQPATISAPATTTTTNSNSNQGSGEGSQPQTNTSNQAVPAGSIVIPGATTTTTVVDGRKEEKPASHLTNMQSVESESTYTATRSHRRSGYVRPKPKPAVKKAVRSHIRDDGDESSTVKTTKTTSNYSSTDAQ